MDGAVFIFVISRRHWHTFFDWIGCPPELEDRVWENRHFRVQNWDVLDNYAAKLFAGISTESAVSFGRNNGLLIAPVNAPLGVFEHPQLKWREWLAAEESGGSRRLPRTPVCFYGRSAPHIRPLTDLPTGEWLSLPLQWSNPGPFQGGGKTRRCNSPAKRLHGLRVVELTMELAGPTLGRLLAERGASVIKIESETHRLRAGIGPGLNESMRLQQQLVYADTNRFRKFISLNLKKAEGRELLHKLLGNSDVFITNLSPRILREWELTPDRLSSRHPELLGVYLTYGGLEGPERDTVGVALTAAAEAGQYQLWGGLESASTVFHTDTFQGIYGGVALLASTVGVQRGLPRVHVDNALLEASAFCNGAQYVSMAYDSEESPKEVKTVTHAVLPALGLDKWLYIELNEPSLGILESLLGYPRQEGEAREREQKIVDGLSTWLLQRNPRTAMQVLQAAGLRAVSVSDEEDVFFDPHLRQRRWYARFTTSDGRGRDVPGFLGSTCSPITDISVTCGEIGSSNQEVFEKELALPPEEVADLTRRGVLY
jgi:crotonobetainyl-CoA:carnitine CoA-transferase CaiB-like acyl-CoA transferase